MELIMEQLSSNINFIQKSFSIRANSSIRLDRKSLISQSKSVNEAVFVMEFQKVMEMIESKPNHFRQAIEMLYPLLEKCSQIKSSKSKLYYMKENLFISLIKLLNKQGDQLRILQCFTQYMPDMMKEAKSLQAKKGNIIMMIILWAKCCYSIEKYQESLLILEKTSAFIDMFQSAKLINLLKISFLKAKVYEQQKRTEDYENEVSYAYFIVKSNNILSTLGLKITQLYHNIKLNDGGKRPSVHRVNRSFSKEKENKGVKNGRQSLQAYTIQSKFLQRNSNVLSFNRKSKSSSNNQSSSKENQRNSSIDGKKISSSIKSNQLNYVFEDIKKSPAKHKRSTFIVQSQITSKLMELGHYKQNSHIQKSSSILKRPQYKKYSLCNRTPIKFSDQPKPQVIEQEVKDTDREDQDLDITELDILSKEGRNNSRRTSRMRIDAGFQNEKEMNEEECILNITPLNFPTEYIKESDERDESFNESFSIELSYVYSFLRSDQLTVKRVVLCYENKLGVYFKIYFHQTRGVVVVKIPCRDEEKVTKEDLCEFLERWFRVKYDEEEFLESRSDVLGSREFKMENQEQRKLKWISQALVSRHLSSKIIPPIGRVYQMESREVKVATNMRYEVKDRLRYDIPKQSRKSRKSCHFRKIVSESELVEVVQKSYFNMYEVMEYQLSSALEIHEIVELMPIITIDSSQITVSNQQQQVTDPINILALIPPLILPENPISNEIFTGKYTFHSTSPNHDLKIRPQQPKSSRQILNNVFQRSSPTQVREFYQMMKYNLLVEQSKQGILEYFNELSMTSIFSIQGIGTCKVQLAVYMVKEIYQRDFVFFKFQIVPLSTKTKKIKFVITKQDIRHYLGIEVAKVITKDHLFCLIKQFRSQFLYIKDALYYSLVINTREHFGYNKFVFYQYQHMNNPKHFLTSKLKDVKILRQKTVKVEVEGKKAFVVLTVEHLKDNDVFKILIYTPSTNRRLEFSLPEKTLKELEYVDQNSVVDWNSVLSTIKFNTLQNNTLIAKIASYSYLVIQSHFASFGKVSNYVFHVCFKVFNKKYPFCYNFLSQVQNIILNELTDYEVYLQINWLRNDRKLCFVFSIIDFIELVLSLPRKNKIHKELECVYFNLADIRLMLSIGYEQIVASLMEFSENQLEELIENKVGKYKLHKLIEQNLKKISKRCLENTQRRIKASMNSEKKRSREDYLDIIHKGLFRYKEKSLIGIFSNSKTQHFAVKTYNKQGISSKEVPFKELSIPFVGQKKQEVLRECNKRIMKMMKNRLLCSNLSKREE